MHWCVFLPFFCSRGWYFPLPARLPEATPSRDDSAWPGVAAFALVIRSLARRPSGLAPPRSASRCGRWLTSPPGVTGRSSPHARTVFVPPRSSKDTPLARKVKAKPSGRSLTLAVLTFLRERVLDEREAGRPASRNEWALGDFSSLS